MPIMRFCTTSPAGAHSSTQTTGLTARAAGWSLMHESGGVAIEVPDVCSYAPPGIDEKTLPPGAAIPA